ncbi:MAG: hypothetical protein VB080_07035 [Propionicimonas sp.]|uniref:hypothetical protein n=1 Tax=Propionicimonas sp. TaxID=1955623 RepID=UPI002B1F7C36|nr:hypothetical protein [Propionicimonas sp.]MEA4944179.1 hypothetical protein [Propionicimonas sp.]
MSSLVLTPGLFRLAAFSLLPLIGAVYLAWPRPAGRRQRQVEKWADQNLARLTPDVSTALDVALTRRNRGGATILAVVAVLALPTSFASTSGAEPGWFWAISVFGVAILALILTGSWQLARPWFQVGPLRSARPRAVGLNDYLLPLVRWIAWGAGVVCLAGAGLAVLFPKSPAQTAAAVVPAVGVVAGVAAAELIGRRIVRLPQPARDDVELYALDAWRAETALTGFLAPTIFGGYVMLLVSGEGVANLWAELVLRAVGIVIWIGLLFALRDLPPYCVAWVRGRLWPQLDDKELIGTGAVTA